MSWYWSHVFRLWSLNVIHNISVSSCYCCFLRFGSTTFYLSHLHNMPPTCCLHTVNGIVRVCYSVSLELVVSRIVNIFSINFIIWYICHSILFQLCWLRLINGTDIHIIPALDILLFAICVDYCTFNISYVQFIMLKVFRWFIFSLKLRLYYIS